MYHNDKYNVEIKICLDNGIYEFDNNSATGKTRLCKELKELQKLNEPVIGYTYGDDKLGIDLSKVIEIVKPKVVLLDRYDMYNNMFHDEMIEWAKDSIVLIDCKDFLDIDYDTGWCDIEMSPEKIEVVQ